MNDFIMAFGLFVIVVIVLCIWWVLHEERNRHGR